MPLPLPVPPLLLLFCIGELLDEATVTGFPRLSTFSAGVVAAVEAATVVAAAVDAAVGFS